ncbi:MAG: WG repeat-containing protein [bacterium]
MKLLLTAALGFIVLPFSTVVSQQSDVTKLYPIRLSGKAGYIDARGNVVIKPKFMRAWKFSEGLAPVQINDDPVFGYINKKGDLVIGPWNGIASVFSEGLALTRKGFIDPTGKTVIEPRFGFAKSFSEGMAQVQLDQCIPLVDCGMIGYIDKTGRVVIKPQFRAANDFHEGFAAVRRGNDEWTFIDRDGKEITRQHFKSDHTKSLEVTTDFSEGLAGVKIDGKWGFINKVGAMVIAPQFDDVEKFSEGLAAISTGCRWGFIDKTGRIVINTQFRYATQFSEGLAAVDPVLWTGQCPPSKSHDKLGYIDRTGKLVIESKFDLAFKFLDGLAEVVTVNPKDQNDLKHGYIDTTGSYIWRPTS